MQLRRLIAPALLILIALGASGCATSAAPEGAGAAVALESNEREIAAKETCAAFGDVLTILGNADAGLREGRMAEQERDGWHRLATRVLSRVPVPEIGQLRDEIEALKTLNPVIGMGVMQATNFQSDESARAFIRIGEACRAEGAEYASEGFTGG